MKIRIALLSLLAVAFAAPQCCFAQENVQEPSDAFKVSLTEDGQLSGHVFAMMDDEEAPIAGKVALTADGKTISAIETDATGNFSFEDVKPGLYTMIGVAGEYVGDKVIEVTPFSTDGEYTAIPLAVAPKMNAGGVFNSYSAMPMQTFSSAPVGTQYYGGYTAGGCSSGCGGGGGRLFSGGGNFRRLAIIGGAVGIAVGVSGPASPDN